MGNGGSLHEDCIKNGWPIKFPPDKAFVVPKAYHHQLDQSCRASSVVAVVLNSKCFFARRRKQGYNSTVTDESMLNESLLPPIFISFLTWRVFGVLRWNNFSQKVWQKLVYIFSHLKHQRHCTTVNQVLLEPRGWWHLQHFGSWATLTQVSCKRSQWRVEKLVIVDWTVLQLGSLNIHHVGGIKQHKCMGMSSGVSLMVHEVWVGVI